MAIDLIRAKTLAALPDFERPRGFGLGAIPLNPDSRLSDLRSLPGVRAAFASGIPAAANLLDFVKGVYNQGTEDSCVAYSLAALQSVSEQESFGRWITFDAEECYVACGGFGSNGILAVDALNWEERAGFRDTVSTQRYPIQTYAFASPINDAGVDIVKGAIASRHPCVLAMLLPSDFNDQFGKNGDCVSDVVTNGYHQVCVVGYTQDTAMILNSWGGGWGTNGIGSVKWEFLQKQEQQNFVYAYTVSELEQPGLMPFFLEEMQGAGAAGLAPRLK
ncbi:MAG: hypothetical protein WA417_06245 [Stellaceae bacterium]